VWINSVRTEKQLFTAEAPIIVAFEPMVRCGKFLSDEKATIHRLKPDNSCLWADEPKRMGSAGSGKQLFTAETAIIVAFYGRRKR
jgi:hypothetical protein